MSTPTPRRAARVLRASEIGEYVFCRRAWWLHHVLGVESANRAQMRDGVTRHVTHGRTVQRAARLQRAARVFLALAICFAITFALAALLSLR